MNKKILDKVVGGLLDLKGVEHKRLKEPTKEDLARRFVLRAGRGGKLEMKEVK